MIVRRSFTCLLRDCPKPIRSGQPFRRGFRSPSASLAAHQQPSPVSMVGGLTNEFDRIAPRFEIQASQITILESPDSFYETLKTRILGAKNRIYLSTLYIGKTEHELVWTIRKALQEQPKLKVSILTDALRGTRESPNPSCASLLAPLVTEFGPDRVEIRMFHTPNLTGLRKRLIPKRINEGWGLQHMKLYGFDDEVIISGANLSNDYFTNRQDRYHVFSSKRIADYFAGVHHAVGSLSYLVEPDLEASQGYRLQWPASNVSASPLDDPAKFKSCASALLNTQIQPSTAPPQFPAGTDTVVYPLAQFTPLLHPDTSTELPSMLALLRALSSPTYTTSRWMFTAGYFNIHPQLSSLLVASSSGNGTVVTASPWANGFYGSKGVSGMLPAAYSLLSRRFLQKVKSAGRGDSIILKEWRRGTVGEKDGWTYHAKGLWVTMPKEEHPSITLVGSSNYTKRSYSLDLEVNILIVTRNESLQRRLGEEQEWLQDYSKKVELDDFTKTERRVGLHVRVAMWIVTLLGGAL